MSDVVSFYKLINQGKFMPAKRTTPVAKPRRPASKKRLKSISVTSPKRKRDAVISLKNILVPVDFSPISQKALRWAYELAKLFGAELTLLHVVEPHPYPDWGFGNAFAREEKLRDVTRKHMNRLCERTEVPTQSVRDILTRVGKPFDEIVEASRELDVDLIVVGTRGMTGLTHVLVGSTAERVLRHAHCPVLVVHE